MGKPKGFEEAVLPEDEVMRRVDLREDAVKEQAPDSPWIGEASDEPPPKVSSDPAPALVTQRVEATRPSRIDDDDRRRLLWRDSATILIGVVLVLLVGQTLMPSQAAGPDGSPTPEPSTIAIGSFGPPVSLPPGATFGPIVDPGLGVDASPTPIPVITMGPTPSPSPTPEPTPTPPPLTAAFTWRQTTGTLKVRFTDVSTGTVVSWRWQFGDGGTAKTATPIRTYAKAGTYSVRLTVTFAGGEASTTTTSIVVKPIPTTPPPTAAPTPTEPPGTDPPVTGPPVTDPPPPPPPSVSIACQVTLPLTVSCDASVANIQGGTQEWSTDGDGTVIGGGDGTNSVTYLYTTSGTHTITLGVTGDDGSPASASEDVTP